MDVSRIMTPNPLTASLDASLDQVMRLMDDNEVRHAPILSGKRLVGVISDRDLLSVTGWLPEAQRPNKSPACVRDLKLKKPITCSPDDSVVMAAVEMSSRAIGCLPVLEGDELIGLVTEMDLLDVYLEMAEDDNSSVHLHDAVVQHMTILPSTLAPESTLQEAMDLEKLRGVRHLPVVDEHRLVGIVSDRDLRRAVGCGRQPSTPISELMSKSVLTLDPEEPISRAASCMLEGRISALPIVDDGRLLGILTLVDLLDHCIVNLRLPDEYVPPR